jgi:hypothetical protein
MLKRFSEKEGFIIILLDIITVVFFLVLALTKILNDHETLASLISLFKKNFHF